MYRSREASTSGVMQEPNSSAQRSHVPSTPGLKPPTYSVSTRIAVRSSGRSVLPQYFACSGAIASMMSRASSALQPLT